MMLDWLGHRHGDQRLLDGAAMIDSAVEQTLATGLVRPFEFGGSNGTADIVKAVGSCLNAAA